MYSSKKLGDKVYILLFNNSVQFHAKLYTHIAKISTQVRRELRFVFTPYNVRNFNWSKLYYVTRQNRIFRIHVVSNVRDLDVDLWQNAL